MKVFSLKKRLLRNTLITSFLAGCLSFLLVIVLVVWEQHGLFDHLLQQHAQQLLQQRFTLKKIEDFQQLHQKRHVRFDTRLSISPQYQPQYQQATWRYQWYDGKLWRVYQQDFEFQQQSYQLALSEELGERYEFLELALWSFVWIMPILLLLLGFGNYWAIRRSLQSFHQVTAQIASKNPQDLSAIQPILPIEELQPMLTSMNELLARLQQAIDAEQRFTADAAHELRTPLAAIQMKLQLLQRRHQQTLLPLQDEFEHLQNDVKRSTAVVENLLLLARLDPAQPLPQSDFALSDFLNELVQMIMPQIQVQQIDFQTEFHIEKQITITANRELLFTALRNLLDNAVRYQKSENPEKRIIFQVKQEDPYLIFSVLDNGCGVSDAEQQRLTQRFYRVLGTGQQGSGLGLSIVQQIIHLHQGKIKFSKGIAHTGLGIHCHLPIE